MQSEKSQFAGIPSVRTTRVRKQLELTLERVVGERVRADGACAVDLWSALANVNWHNPDGETASYSFRTAGDVVAWIHEDGDYMTWYCSGPPGVVAPWINDAMTAEGWAWTLA